MATPVLRQSGLAVPAAYAEPPEKTLRITVSSEQDARQVVAEQMVIAKTARQLGCTSVTLDVESEIAQSLNAILLNAFANTKRSFRFRNKEDHSIFYQLYVNAPAAGPRLEPPKGILRRVKAEIPELAPAPAPEEAKKPRRKRVAVPPSVDPAAPV